MEKYTNPLKDFTLSYRDIHKDVVKERVCRFTMKTKSTPPDHLKQPWKGLIIYTLVEYFEWDLKEAADFLEVSTKTARGNLSEARRLYNMATLTSKITANGAKFVVDLRDYIYYNMYRR